MVLHEYQYNDTSGGSYLYRQNKEWMDQLYYRDIAIKI